MLATHGSTAWFLLCVALCLPTGCERTESAQPASTLLFSGTGTSSNDVDAIASILDEKGIAYDTASSAQLNNMSEAQLRSYRLIIFPGGNYITMGNHLTPEAARRVRDSIHHGVNYLGICAGGLLAGNARSISLDLASGVRFGFYKVVNQGIHKAAVPIDCAQMPVVEQYWEDGPEFTGWGTVIGKYPDGTPAIVEGQVGQGWVILSGVHPEAPDRWRRDLPFSTPARAANEYAGTLIDAALNGRSLPHY